MYPNNNCSDCSPCPSPVTPLPLPNLYGQCGDHYDLSCVEYTGEDIPCLGIISGMMVSEILQIFQTAVQSCGCCVVLPQNCVLSNWSAWGSCTCTVDGSNIATCTQTRTKTIITPPLHGGTECGPTSETRTFVIQPICFTFGSYICETGLNSTQVIGTGSCYYNGKPNYQFTLCGHTKNVWFNSSNNLWYISDTLGVVGTGSATLNNGGADYPISNNIDQTWSTGDLISSQFLPCPTANICFKITILVYGRVFIYYRNVAAAYLDANGFPEYIFNISTPDSNNYSFIVKYISPNWVFQSSLNGGAFVTMSTLSTAGLYYPLSNNWTNTETSNPKLLLTSYGVCTQPADVNCSGTWGAWSTCDSSGSQTRTYIVTTPASGNGTPCPTTESRTCGTPPYCLPPGAPATVSVSGTSIIVSFTPVSGSTSYSVSYTTNGGSSYTTVTSTTSPITISTQYICGAIYSGTITTNCPTLSSDSQLAFGPYTAPACPPPPQLCNGSTINFIAGVFKNNNASVNNIFKINSTNGSVTQTTPAIVGTAQLAQSFPYFWTNELTDDGIVIGGSPTNITLNNLTNGSSGGLFKLKCAPVTGTYLSEINFSFQTTDISSFIGGTGFLAVTATNSQPGLIRALKYDKTLNRLYVGGHFDSYKNAPCSSNLICLNATTGLIDPSFSLLGPGGITSTSYRNDINTGVYDIQIDGNKKIVVAGMFNSYSTNTGTFPTVSNIVRLNSTGSLDTTYNPSNKSFSTYQADPIYLTPPPSVVKSIYIDSSNDIYAVGGFSTYDDQAANHIVKIKNNGDKASSGEFDSGTGFLNNPYTGTGTTNRGWNKVLFSLERNIYGGGSGITMEKIVYHNDGSNEGLLVAGNFPMYNGIIVNALVKITLTGGVDGTFARDTDTFNPSDTVALRKSGLEIKVLSNNKILFGGAINHYLGATDNHNGYYVLEADGTINYSTYLFRDSSESTPIVKTIASYFM